ncbi:hypothetical protein IA57_01065 [Mangrovimonas yunxiaonensis]|uniref:Histidine kinase/HSP90-like ATPase domain-containing protein n=1 Tax=Mangrovimonas yunxiaonensis TaxID=1197477 RepID=A0A084TNH3_9FLAO|nr:sensor histidine kinase [Mangrovimonas yunxiaonensis]KFB02259.1 hypothetical protein IA57_01065 [Mangrovimonas yunxiaonensis]GGH39262.1 hypothetical protein GCM10011364_08560 [Mangrovimonas yunxiaonensis]
MFSTKLWSQNIEAFKRFERELNQISSEEEKLKAAVTFWQNDSVILHKESSKLVSKFRAFALKNNAWDAALLFNNKLTDYYIFSSINNEKAFQLSQDFYRHITQCTAPKQIAKYYINYAEAATYKQDFKASLHILNECISRLKTTQDTTLQEYGYAYLKAGENSGKVNNISESAAYFKKAGEIFTQQKDTLYYLWTQNGLSTLFSSNGLYEEAEQTRTPIYNLGNRANYKQVLIMAHLRASIDAFLQEKDTLELYHIDQALKTCKRSTKTDVSKIVSILTNSYAVGTYARHGQLQKSDRILAHLQKDLNDINKTPFLKTYFTFGKAQNDLGHNNTKRAEEDLTALLPKLKHANEASNVLKAHYILASVYEKQDNNNQALNHYKAYMRIKDSLNKSASKKKFAYVQTQFEVEKKDLDIEKQQKNILLLSAQNKLKNQWLIFGGVFVMGVFIIFFLWKSRKFTQKKMALQKTYAQDLIANIETERKRISSELHDSIGQNLLLIKNSIILNPEKTKDTQLIDSTIEEVRHLSQNLHPFQFEKLGLMASIKNTIENFQKNSDIFYSEDIEVSDLNLSKEKEIFVYRMLQECLNNVEKHSKAKACNVMVETSAHHVLFQVKDNGIGFNVTANSSALNSLGMKTLKERAGIIGAQLHMTSIKNKGTTVKIKVPKE